MNNNNSGFSIAQQIGKSLFMAIAVLPFAGLLLGVGTSFSNPSTIALYHLNGIIYRGGFLFDCFTIMASAGGAIFSNLPLIFALAVAIGMTKKEKGVGVLGAAILYFLMLTTIHVFLRMDGSIYPDGTINPDVHKGTIASVLGITTLQMGAFAGILSGLIAATLCNRFHNIQFPDIFAFFGGIRFIPIICMIFGIISGWIMYLIWPFIQDFIFKLGDLVEHTGYFGTFIYGCCERALIPFGLHHVFYMPFWQTGLGGMAVIDGETIMGAQNIFFAQLSSPDTEHFSADAARFLMGKYPFMMAGLPAAALAMYTCARSENRKVAGSLLFSVALTSFLTGITEPIEFTFLFLAPRLFMIHVFLAGCSFAACHMLNIAIGSTFSDGLIEFFLYGILPGQDKTNWMMMLPLFAVFALIYFVLFRAYILKYDLKTPGRGSEDEFHMVSKEEYLQAKNAGFVNDIEDFNLIAKFLTPDQLKSATILSGLGGMDNIMNLDCCATRLRLDVKDPEKLNKTLLKSTGAANVFIKGDAVQVIYGPNVTIIKSSLESFIEDIRNGKFDRGIIDRKKSKNYDLDDSNSKKSNLRDDIFGAHLNGRMMLINEVEDDGFSYRGIGDGVAIEPSEGKLFAPADGKINLIFPAKQAIGMITKSGAELLMHIGIDTVKLKGEHFEVHVTDDQEVKRGDLLVTFDMDAIKKAGYLLTTPLIVTNSPAYKIIRPLKTGDVKAGIDDLLEVVVK